MKYLMIALLGLSLFSACQNGQNSQNNVTSNEPTPTGSGSETLTFTDGLINMKGFVAYPSNPEPRPAVLIVHEWWGLDEYVMHRAEMLAALGYVAIAIDLYGNGIVANNPEEAQKLAAPFYSDFPMAKQRFEAALQAIKKLPRLDTSRIAAIGYCFGGTQVLNMARMGVPLNAVVSFHGSMRFAPLEQHTTSKPAILVCNGAADAFVSQKDLDHFGQEMEAAGFDYSFKNYEDALHAFTNPASDITAQKFGLNNVGYNAAADSASWMDMRQFLGKNLQ
jgi:dienelactone hydrolase